LLSCQVFSSVLVNGNVIVIVLFVQINFQWWPENLSLSKNTAPGGGGGGGIEEKMLPGGGGVH